jgi:lipoprotein NlpI
MQASIHQMHSAVIFACLLIATLASTNATADEPESGSNPQSGQAMPAADSDKATQQKMVEGFQRQLAALPANLSSVEVCSRRGDLLFFTAEFDKAVESYEAMVQLNPQLDESHWRLGIAYFFNNQPEKAFRQFDKYHAFDDVDRENGIWRFLSQYQAAGAEAAKKQLLRYQKDDREPFPAVYRLFEGTLTPTQVLQSIPADLPEVERDKRLFYAELYVGLHHLVQNRRADAKKFLKQAVDRSWPQTAGFGPHYMWQVAQVQLAELQQDDSPAEAVSASEDN